MSSYISLKFSPIGTLENSVSQNRYSDNYFSIRSNNLVVPLRKYNKDSMILFIGGRPMVNGKMDDNLVVKLLLNSDYISSVAPIINGSFIIIIFDSSNKILNIISDRFSSQKIYFDVYKDILYADSNLIDLCKVLASVKSVEINESAMFEFLYFRRLFGTKTYEKNCKLLNSASVLEYKSSPKEVIINSYWSPSFERLKGDVNSISSQLANSLRESMNIYTSDVDNSNAGLLLSGGLDSRALLAASRKKIVCYTTCPERNNESFVAEEVSRISGNENVFIPRPKGNINDSIDYLTRITSGEHSLTNMQFYGYQNYIPSNISSIFLGIGLDIFFGGLYQHKNIKTYLGKRSLHFKLNHLPFNIRDLFIDNIRYRLRTSNAYSIVRKEYIKDMCDHLVQGVDEILNDARMLTDDPYDMWEFMHAQPLSRHYSFSMAESIRTFVECRIPALENNLYDLFFSIPPEFKTNWTVYRKAIKILSPELMKIRNANTNVQASYPFLVQSFVVWYRAFSNRFFGTENLLPPKGIDRSWISDSDHISENQNLKLAVQNISNSDILGDLRFIDMNCIRELVEQHFSGKKDNSILLLHLVSVERLISQIR